MRRHEGKKEGKDEALREEERGGKERGRGS